MPSINYQAPLGTTGYGVAGSNFYKELYKLHNVSLFPIGEPVCQERDLETFQQGVKNAEMFEVDAPFLKIWHQFDLATRVGRGHYFAMPIFELDTFTEKEKHHLKSVDTVVVNSKWAQEVVKNQVGNVPTEVVPLGYDPTIFNSNYTVMFPKQTRFLNIGKWEIRKGHDILADAFAKAFEGDDDVELLMCNYNPFYTKEQNLEWQKMYYDRLGDKVKFVPWQESQTQVAILMGNCDCGVFPSRGEGWNLEALEMMACNKPVIVTDYSAHTEFCNEDNARLIKVDQVEQAFDGKWFNGQGNWATLGQEQIDELIHHMREVHKWKQEGGQVNNPHIVDVSEYTWENSTKKLSNILTQYLN